ncbi:NADAR family protein [Streptomyces sp. NBC_00193]|uniref:NADAR family protein n=1 Tax=Streptomyces sp. NBC_00193 TaxID=2975675 RepID=UPI002257A1ED|nr:NADAR family protein [Streptomyces sp. NBC_00193]MCX5295160.1 NADAR family protein [Streptomyces sp. NBC_00193]
MTWHGPTFRISDGETINGAWCLVWRRHDLLDDHHPENLFVYADGRITRGGYEATDLAGLARLLASGKVALTLPDGRERTAEPSKWLARYPEPRTDESFLAEVADEISRLAGRPSAHDLLMEAVRAYRRETTEANRALLRVAYLAVPAHLRVFVLGDMDRQDRPLRILVTDLGEPVDGDGPVATPELHQGALDYFADVDASVERAEQERVVRYADAPVGAPQPPVVLHETVYPRGWPAELGTFALRNDYDAPFTYAGETYPTVVHGYWALFAADRADHDRIRAAATAREAQELGAGAAGRADWAARRLAVMAGLLRAKFDQHPRLAELLAATGEGAILYTGISDAPFWRDEGPRGGRNWIGRLLELIRSELLAAGAGAGRAG